MHDDGHLRSQLEPQESLNLPPLSEIHSLRIPTIVHIPKAARPEFARLLADELESLSSSPALVSLWSRVLLIAKTILSVNCLQGSREEGRSQAAIIKERIKRWRKGDIVSLLNEAKTGKNRRQRGKRKRATEIPTQEEMNLRRAKKFIAEGQYSRASEALGSQGLAEVNEETVNEMKQKHPQAPVPRLAPLPDAQPLKLTTDQIRKSLKSFKKGSAPGLSGLRAEHLKASINSGSPVVQDRVISAVTKFGNVLLAGMVPKAVSPFFYGARLHGAKKKDGTLRPIAVGEVLRRLASKCAMSVIKEKAVSLLSPLQLGVGVPGGCETVVHVVQALLNEKNDDLAVVQVDYVNAFNLADRATAFKEVQ